MKCFLVAFALTFACIAQAQDSARQLARILAEKGLLTNDELVNIERAEADDAVRLLSGVLYKKGFLTQSEMARVFGPTAGAEGDAHFVPVVATAFVPTATVASAVVPTVPASPAQAATSPSPGAIQIPELTTASHFPVQIYGTVLWNSFYNTGGTNIEDIPLVASKRGTDPYSNFGMTVRQSRFGLRYQGGPEVWGAKLSGTLELDLLGGAAPLANGVGMDLVRLRLAYGRMDWKTTAIEAGQDWSGGCLLGSGRFSFR